jgi:trimeric autotransporter adhesin
MPKMKCFTRLFVVFLLALGLSAATGQAQTLIGTVQGKVLDQQGAVLPGVNVTLTGDRGSQTTVTDGHGEFRFVGTAPGTYVLKAEIPGFLPQQREQVIVGMGKTIDVEFTLKVGGCPRRSKSAARRPPLT